MRFSASTVPVSNTVETLLPGIKAAAPKEMKVTSLFDQSVLVAGAIGDVLRKGAIGAGATGLMILRFLRSWRSTHRPRTLHLRAAPRPRIVASVAIHSHLHSGGQAACLSV